MSDLAGVPPEAVEAVARTLWRFQTSETWEERERQFPDSTDLMRTRDKARIILAAAAPHLQRQAAAEIALKIASVAADLAVRTGWTYTETHRQLMAASGYVPAPSVQRSSNDD